MCSKLLFGDDILAPGWCADLLYASVLEIKIEHALFGNLARLATGLDTMQQSSFASRLLMMSERVTCMNHQCTHASKKSA